MPDLLAAGPIAGAVPVVQQREQLFRLLDIGRLAAASAGFQILTPHGPLVLDLVSRRELLGDGVGGGKTVFQAFPDRHDGLARIDAVADDVPLGRFAVQLDAHLLPAVAHERQNVRLLGALAGGLHDDLGGASVGQEPEAVVVARC